MLHCLGDQDSIIQELLAFIRDKERHNQRQTFRACIERLGFLMGYELSRHLSYRSRRINTPLAATEVRLLETQPVIASILRAGLPLHSGVLQAFPEADNCFIGAYRKHAPDGSFSIQLDYLATPDLNNRTLILVDPMLATGASLVKTLTALFQKQKPARLEIISVIAARPGIDQVQAAFPHAGIWVAAIDPELNEHGYIVPGLGDAGDLCFGETLPR